ncbi:MAG: hypothetical protein ACTHN5_06060 [Phycisphaerae bacterium]
MLTNILLGCAVLGGAIVLVQVVASVFAIGAGHAFHLHHHGGGGAVMRGGHGLHGGHVVRGGHLLKSVGKTGKSPAAHAPQQQASVHGGRGMHWGSAWLWGMLNFQAIVAGVAVFGIGGLAAKSGGFSTGVVLAAGGVAAFVVMLGVTGLFSLMLSMDHDATVRVEEAVGAMGTVYLSIPGGDVGQGKVMVKLQERLMEFPAVTLQERPLATGEQIIVVNVRKPSTMEVVSAERYLTDTGAISVGTAPNR